MSNTRRRLKMPRPDRGGEKPKDIKKTLKRFAVEVKPFKKVLEEAVL